MHFEYKDMVVSTVPIIRMESRTEQGTEKTEATTQTTETINSSIPQTMQGSDQQEDRYLHHKTLLP